jgi:ankyrin repeat protein
MVTEEDVRVATIYMRMICEKHCNRLDTLLKKRQARDEEGTLAYHAALSGQLEVVKRLIESKRDVEEVCARGTLAHALCFSGMATLIPLLPHHLHFVARKTDLLLPAHVAARYSYDCLISLSPLTFNSPDAEGCIPIVHAIKSKNEKTQAFLAKFSNSLWKDSNGWTLLHYAARFNAFVCIDDLCLRVDKAAVDIMGRTALHIAALFENNDAFAKLVENGFNLSDKDEQGVSCVEIWGCHSK